MSVLSRDNGKRYVPFFPIFAAATFAVLLDIVATTLDEVVVGNMFPDVAFGAINLLEPCILAEHFLAYLICVGGAALIVRARGKGDSGRMNDIFSLCITSCFFIGVLFAAAFTLFKTPIVDMAAGGTDAVPYVEEALSRERLYVFTDPYYTFLFTFVLYMGGTVISAIAAAVYIGCNLGLSILLGESMGIGGVVLATGIAQLISVAVMSLFFLIRKPGVRPRFYWNGRLAKQIVTISFPESSDILAFSLMVAAVNAVALKNYDIQGLVVMSVMINAAEAVGLISEGISEYETVSMNEYLGQGSLERIRQCIRVTIRAAVIEGLFFSMLFLIGPDAVVSIFDIDDPAVREIAANALRVLAVIPVGMCITRILAIYYQYTKRIPRAAAIWILSWGVFPAVLSYLFGGASLNGLIAGFIAGFVAVLPLLFIYVRFIKKETFTADIHSIIGQAE